MDSVLARKLPVFTELLGPNKISKIFLTGNTLVSDEELRKVYGPYGGKQLTVAQLKEIARNLTAVYQKAGSFLVRVYLPQQTIANGQAELRVLEGKIGKVTVEGAENYDPEYIRERFRQSFQ